MILSGGLQAIWGTASSTIVVNGLDAIFSGGSALGTTVSNGGTEFVELGGYAHGTIVDGGVQAVESGGYASATVVNGGHLLVGFGGSASATIINSGDELVGGPLGSGGAFRGVGYNATINSLGVEVVELWGETVGDTIDGGVQVVFGGSVGLFYVTLNGTFDATINGGGTQVVWGGAADGDTVNSGGFVYVVSEGFATANIINPGGTEYVISLGLDYGSEIYGTQVVSNASVDGTGVAQSGVLIVDSAGDAASTYVSSGGLLFVESGGNAASGRIAAGGSDYLYGGITTQMYILGTEYVASGGSAIGNSVLAGGLEFVGSVGTAIDTFVYSGGTMDVASGGSIGNTSVFLSSDGTLRLEDSVHFSGQIFGFYAGETNYLDLRDILYGSGTNRSFSADTLTVTDGAHTASLTLLSDLTTADFHIENDGFGGTLVYDPSPSMQVSGTSLAAHST
jgi:autotransporter passenger strand-loop-strand repeat protein